MIIGISGLVTDAAGLTGSAGAGKSTVADRLVSKHGFVQMGFADALKRTVGAIFDFTDEQLWGTQAEKETPDLRYLRKAAGYREIREVVPLAGDAFGPVERTEWSAEYLTPRLACQLVGTAGFRAAYGKVWVRRLIRDAQLVQAGYTYDCRLGVGPLSVEENNRGKCPDICISDMRFVEELEGIKEAGGAVIRVRRQVETLFTDNQHQSENALSSLPDSAFAYTIYGLPQNVADLQLRTDQMLDWLTGRIRTYDEGQAEVPPYLRAKQCCSRDTNCDGDCDRHPAK